MNIVIGRDYEEMSRAAFAIVRQVVRENPTALLGLATGTTPLGLYQKMIEDHQKTGTSYKQISAVNLDEYISLAADHKQSYAYFMKENLFSKLDIDLKNTHIENGTAKDEAAECARYNALLEARPQDLQILGIGGNGHIAFNEPGTPFASETHVVDLSERTVRDNSRLFSSIDEVPRRAFTMGLKNIMKAKKILILASGEGKADAVYGMVCGEITEGLPASILRLHGDCTLVCDEAAAVRLPSSVREVRLESV